MHQAYGCLTGRLCRRVLIALALACWVPVVVAKGPATLSVGVCKAEITPVSNALVDAYRDRFGEVMTPNHSDPIYMAGFGNNRQATGYNDRLWARGVVIDGRGGRIAIVALDLIGYFNNQVEIVRNMLGDDIDYLIVQSSHSHEGPDTLGIWGPNEFTTGVDPGYIDFVNSAIADCINDASGNMQRARVKSATVSTQGLSMGMRPEDDGFGVGDQKVLEGDDILSPETNGRIVDPNLVVLQFTEQKKKKDVIATLVNFGSHPEALWSQNTLLTSDFPHYVRERLEQEYGGTAIWISGALGVLQGPDRIDVTEDGINPVLPRRTFRLPRSTGPSWRNVLSRR